MEVFVWCYGVWVVRGDWVVSRVRGLFVLGFYGGGLGDVVLSFGVRGENVGYRCG